jgi:hypothetical protein
MFRKPFITVIRRDRALASPDTTDVGLRFRQGLEADPEATHVVVLVTEGRSSCAFPRGPGEAALMIDQAARAMAPQDAPVIADDDVIQEIHAAAQMLNLEASGGAKH